MNDTDAALPVIDNIEDLTSPRGGRSLWDL
jgi:hypothetical protein